MNAPRLYYPIKPFHVNQPFGANIPCVKDFGLATQEIVDGADNDTCPVGFTKLYAAFGMNGHDGTDLQAGEQNVYAACAGTVIEMQTVASRGLGLGIITDEIADLGANGQHYLKVRYWHLKSFNVQVGQHVNVGDIIAVSDNTGYSSADHLHFEGDPMDKDAAGNYQLTFPNNGYVGAIDIAPYFTGTYAQDYALLNTLLSETVPLLTKLITLLRIHLTSSN
jgi:murein DD-endopeptidase MepM/ murein hydrolase activator NlpD